jgi:hypothetical protein
MIEDVDLFDAGPVTYPAYDGTDVKARAVELRSIFPEGIPEKLQRFIPAELRDGIEDTPNDPGDGGDDGDADDMEECSCRCRACYSGDHEECDDYMAECPDAQRCGDMAAMRSAEVAREKRDGKKTKRVDGEDLPMSAFAYVGDETLTKTWHLPIKFSTDAKTTSHIRNALSRFNQTDMPDATKKAAAWKKIVAAAKAHGIHVSGESNSAPLSLELAKARTRLAQLSLQ